MRWGDKKKWSEEVKKEVRKTIKNFNAKIARIEKKNPTIAEYQPEKLKYKDVIEKINSKQDFQRELNSLKRYSEKGVENVKTYESGLTLTDYEVKEVKKKVQILNTIKTNKAKKLGIDVEKGNMGTLEKANLKPTKFSVNKSESEWEAFSRSLDKRINSVYDKETLELYKRNYLKSLNTKLALSDNHPLVKKIRKMSTKKLFEFSAGNPFVNIDFVYDSNIDDGDRLERLEQEWEGA